MPIFSQMSIYMNPYPRIGSLHLIKVALLVAFLVVLPRLVGYLDVMEFGSAYFSDASLPDLVLRIILFFIFSWTLLELNVNGQWFLPKMPKFYRIVGIYILNIAMVFLFAAVFKVLYSWIIPMGSEQEEPRFIGTVFFALAVILIFVSNIIGLQKVRQVKMMENVELKQQNLQKELAALKNQVNPHFLFNSLNSLSALVRENKPAASFVKNLSFLYRYILQSGELDLVTVDEELRFLRSYMDLIEVRYGSKIKCDININRSLIQREIPPLAMQLLVENAVKHNEISEKHPLQISLFSKENSIVVENRIKPRKSMPQSNGVGLANLDRRYKLLMGQNISIQKKDGNFSVELPLNEIK